MLALLLDVLRAAWHAGNEAAGMITPPMYFAFIVRFVLALEVGFCSNYIYVALAQFWIKARSKEDAVRAGKSECYVAHRDVKDDVVYAASRGETYRHVSEFSGTTVRGSLTLPTVIVSVSVFLCLLAVFARAVGHANNVPLTPPLPFMARLFGYAMIVLTGIVPCPPNENLSSRAYSIVIGSWQGLDSKWQSLHGLGMGLYCWVPLVAQAVEAAVLQSADGERWAALALQFAVTLTCFALILAQCFLTPTDRNHSQCQLLRRLTFLFEVLSLFIALFQYTSHELSLLSNMLGPDEYSHTTFSLMWQSTTMLCLSTGSYEASAVAFAWLSALRRERVSPRLANAALRRLKSIELRIRAFDETTARSPQKR
jgi:hypothetical protein